VPRPCYADHPTPRPESCPRCRRWRDDYRFRALWGPDPAPLAPPLRVLHVGAAMVLAGAEVQLQGLVKYLDPARVAVTESLVANPKLFDPAVAKQLGVPCRVAGRDEMRAACKGADVLLCWGWPLDEWLADVRPPLGVFVAHGEGDWTRKALDGCARVTDHVVAVGQRVADATCAGYPTTVIPNGIDLARIAPTRPRAEARAALGLAEGDFVLLYAGRFSGEKHPEVALEALALLPARFKLVMAGWGPMGPLLRKAAAERLPGRVVFAPPDGPMGDYYRAADALVNCSDQEGMSLVLLEAMFSGLPIAATAVGSVPEMARAGARFAAHDGTPDDLARRVTDAAEEPDYRAAIKAANLAYADEHGHARTMSERYQALLTSLAAARGLPRRPRRPRSDKPRVALGKPQT
jgi:glycosyltransferase involved in cell wall biosynthesis